MDHGTTIRKTLSTVASNQNISPSINSTMLSHRPVRKLFSTAAAATTTTTTTTTTTPISNKPKPQTQHLLAKLKAERDPEKLFTLFKNNASSPLLIENRFAYEDTINRFAGARRFDLVEQLLEHQKTMPQSRREGFVVRIIMLYGKSGMPKHALKTFHDMHLFNCRRTVKSFNATLKTLTLARKFDQIAPFFAEIPQRFAISPDKFSFNLVINALCEMGSLDSAYLIMLEMEKAGFKPDIVTFTTLLSAFYKNHRREIGDGIWNLMVMRGCRPNLATFNVRIQFLVNKGRAWQAWSLVRKMVILGINPDELTYNLLIKGFGRMGNVGMAKRIFFSLSGWGCNPNCKIYQTMIHYLCKEKDFDWAFRLSKESMPRNWFPNVDTISELVEGLVKSSMVESAREVIELLRRRVPPFSRDDLRRFEALLYKDGEVCNP